MASIKKRPNGSWRARYRDEAGRDTRGILSERWTPSAGWMKSRPA